MIGNTVYLILILRFLIVIVESLHQICTDFEVLGCGLVTDDLTVSDSLMRRWFVLIQTSLSLLIQEVRFWSLVFLPM